MRKTGCFLSVMAIGLTLVLAKGYAEYLNALSATIAVKTLEGQKILGLLINERVASGEPCEVVYASIGRNCSTSTELINSLSNSYFKANDRLFENVSQSNNIWTVVGSIPANAPTNFIIMVTKNVDPKTLRLRLTQPEMDGHVTYLPSEKRGLLKKCAIIIRLDGSYYVRRFSRFSSHGDTYRAFYDNCPFDMTTNGVSALVIRYLTPNGEVIVDETCGQAESP